MITFQSKRRANGPRSGSDGFTIAEVLISVAIMGLMMVAITRLLTSVRVTRDRVHNIQETQLAGPVIVDMIVRDLYAIHVADRPLISHLQVQNRVEYGLDADRIDFVTTTNSREARVEDDRQLRADVCEVGYVTRVRPDDDQFLELYRREGFGVDEDPFQGGNYTFLSDRVKSLIIDVYAEDGPDIEPLEEWGMDLNDPETQGLPAWIEVQLTLENTPRLLREQIERNSRERSTVTYRRIYRFPEALRFEDETAIPRFGIPTRPDAGGGAGEDGEENVAEDTSGVQGDITLTGGDTGGGRGGGGRGNPGEGGGGGGKPVQTVDRSGAGGGGGGGA